MLRKSLVSLAALFFALAVPALADPPVFNASGTLGVLNAAVTVTPTPAIASCSAGITGTWVGTQTFEVYDGQQWAAVNVYPPASTTAQTTTTANGSFNANVASYQGFRVRTSAYTSGSAVVTVQCTGAVAHVAGGGGGGGGAQVYPQAQACSATNQTLANATWATICTVTFTALGTSAGPSAAWRVRLYASGGSGSQVLSDGICITGTSAGTVTVGTTAFGLQTAGCPSSVATATNPLAGMNRGSATNSLQAEYSAQYANGSAPVFNCQLVQATGTATNGCNMSGLAEPI